MQTRRSFNVHVVSLILRCLKIKIYYIHLINHLDIFLFIDPSHLETSDSRFSTGGYFCPICNNKYCELPVECKVCGITLVIAPHLARSYHHLFPLEPYKEINNEANIDPKSSNNE